MTGDDYEPPSGPHETQPIDWRLTRFLLRHCATGVAAGWTLLLGLVWTDVGSIGSLMDKADGGWIALVMLALSFALTGGAVAMAIAAMAMGGKGDR